MALSNAFMGASITLRDVAVNTNRVRRISRSVKNARMETFSHRLKRLRIAAGLSQERLAHACGYSGQSRIGNYEGGKRTPSLNEIPNLAKALGVSEAELVATLPPSSDDGDWAPVMAYKLAASLGNGAQPDEYAETHSLKFRADSLRRKRLHPERLGVLYGRGDSMLPNIKSGDAILFDRSDIQPKDGKLFVINYDGDLYAKRLIEIDGMWFASSDNFDLYKPIRLDPARGVVIIGRVRWTAGWVD